ncbi:hypothetical protein P691DRAFT_299571 [Macrolepiota fuliginosa MF-IS2]|uniref:C2H2-type domain-containing protein n=1 Tax=Macrolepiota fuliginosa MF-IS2 TaxID=1400762 RepID=A0A9P6BY97_9AGAR|nr:hypothetical protein P691DRAFT_299571 [Macrolepiota fuliginosa MF-IS2]
MRQASKLVSRSGPVRKGDGYCKTCDHDYKRYADLQRHLLGTLKHNPNARRFSCKYCGALLTQRANLLVHERTHFPEKPETCGLPVYGDGVVEACTFACKDPSSLIRHVKTKHFMPYSDKGEPIPAQVSTADKDRRKSKRQATRNQTTATEKLGRPKASSSFSKSSSPESSLATPSPKNAYAAQVSVLDFDVPSAPPSPRPTNDTAPKPTNSVVRVATPEPELHFNYDSAIYTGPQPNKPATTPALPTSFEDFSQTASFHPSFYDNLRYPVAQMPNDIATNNWPMMGLGYPFSGFGQPQPSGELHMFPDTAPNTLSQLFDDNQLSVFGSQTANAGTSSMMEPISLFDTVGQNAPVTWYDYSDWMGPAISGSFPGNF